MQVSSEPGNGSRFDILIPAVAPALLDSDAASSPVAKASRGSGQLVLVVDDEPQIRQTARAALESYGYRVAVAGNGREALDYLARFPEDSPLVFSDIAMPVMDGPALLAELTARYPHLAVLMTSGLSVWAPEPESRQGFLAKPYTIDQLRAEVARLFSLD